MSANYNDNDPEDDDDYKDIQAGRVTPETFIPPRVAAAAPAPVAVQAAAPPVDDGAIPTADTAPANPVIRSFDTPGASATPTTPAPAPDPAPPVQTLPTAPAPTPAAPPQAAQAPVAQDQQPAQAAPAQYAQPSADDADAQPSAGSAAPMSNEDRINAYFSQQKAALAYHKSQGGQVETLPTGAQVIKQDADGNPLYNEAVIQPFVRGDDGNGYRVNRDAYGNQHWFDISQGAEGQDFHVDPQTGEKYVTTSGADGSSKRETVGQDPLVPAMNAAMQQAQAHGNTMAQASVQEAQATNGVQGAGPIRAASLADLRGEAGDISKSLKPLQQQLTDLKSYAPPEGSTDPADSADLTQAKQLADQIAFKTNRLNTVQGEIDARDSTIGNARQQYDQARQGQLNAGMQVQMYRQVRRLGGMDAVQNDLETVASGGAVRQDRAGALASVGLLSAEAQPDGSTVMRVTPAAVPMLSDDTQKALAQNPQQFQVSGQPVPAHVQAAGDAIAQVHADTTDDASTTNNGSQAQKPYVVAPDGSVHFDTGDVGASIQAAAKDGVIDKNSASQYLAAANGGSNGSTASGQAGSSSPSAAPGSTAATTPTTGQPQKAYTVGQDGKLSFDPDRSTMGVAQAIKDGALDPASAPQTLDLAQKADRQRADLLKQAGGAPQLKALLAGIAPGLGFVGAGTAAAAAGNLGPNETISALTGPFAPATEAVLSGAEFIGGGMLGSRAAKALQAKAADYSDTIKSLNAAAQLHPGWEAAGELIPALPSAVTSIGNLGKIGSIAASDLGEGASAGAKAIAATKAIAKPVVSAAVGGAATEGILRPVVETGLNKAADALGIKHDDVQAPTLSSIGQMAALGGLLVAHHAEFADYSPAKMSNILSRGQAHEATGVPMDKPVTKAQMVAQFGDHASGDNAAYGSIAGPLSPGEQAIYSKAQARIEQLRQQGDTQAGNAPLTAKQATLGGQPLATSLDVRPAGSEDSAGPAKNQPQSPDGDAPDKPGLSTAAPKSPSPQGSAASDPAGSPSSGETPAKDESGAIRTSPSPTATEPPPAGQASSTPEAGDTFTSGGVRYSVTGADDKTVAIRPESAPASAPPLQIPRAHIEDQISSGASQLEKAPQADAPTVGVGDTLVARNGDRHTVSRVDDQGHAWTTEDPKNPGYVGMEQRFSPQSIENFTANGGRIEKAAPSEDAPAAAGSKAGGKPPSVASSAEGSNGAAPAPPEAGKSSPQEASSAPDKDSTPAAPADPHANMADLVNRGAKTDNPDGPASLPFQVLSKLKAAGVEVTPETSRAVHAHLADVEKLPESERQHALEEMLWNHVPAQAETPTANEPRIEPNKPANEPEPPAKPAAPLTPRSQGAKTLLDGINGREAAGHELSADQKAHRTQLDTVVADEQAKAERSAAAPREAAQAAHDALTTKQARGESLTGEEATRLDNAKKLLGGGDERPAGNTASATTQPTSEAGKSAQRTIDTLTTRQKANNGFLSPADRDKLQAARETLDRELNRQVLGPNPQPTSESGKAALAQIQRFQEARDAGAQLLPSEHAAWKNQREILESDFTRQRQAIESQGGASVSHNGPKDQPVSHNGGSPVAPTPEPVTSRPAATFKEGAKVTYKGRRAVVESIGDDGRATVRVQADGNGLKAVRMRGVDPANLEKQVKPTEAQPGETSASPTDNVPSKITVPRQPGDTESVAVAREQLADQRRMGNWPTVREVQKLGRISMADAERVLADQRKAESQAAEATGNDTPTTRTANAAKHLENFRSLEGEGKQLTPGELAQARAMRAALDEAGVPAHEQPPYLAAEAADTARSQVEAIRPELRGMGVRDVEYDGTGAASGVEFAPDGTLHLDPAKVAKSMTTVRDNQSKLKLDGTPEDWFSQVLHHESFHGVGNEVAKAQGFTDAQGNADPAAFYGSLPDDALPKDMDEKGRAAYGPAWDQMAPWQRKAEFVRMFLEGKYFGRITEAFQKFIRPIVDYFNRMASGNGVDPRFKAFVRPFEQRIDRAYSEADPASAEQPFKRPSRAAVTEQTRLVRKLEAAANGNPDNADVVARYQDAAKQLAEMQRQKNLPLQEGESPRSFKMPSAPSGDPDVLDHIVELGGILSPKEAQARKNYNPRLHGDYDDAPPLSGFYHHAVYGGAKMPDLMAASLHENHGIGDGDIHGMWDAIASAVKQRRTAAEQMKSHAVLEKQAGRFDKDALQPGTAKGKTQVYVDNLAPGDKVQIGDQTLTVKGIDPKTMDVELDDHSKYGVQKVAEGTALYVEKVQPADGGSDDARLAASRPDPHTGSLFGGDEPFDLRGEAASDPERVAAALEEARRAPAPAEERAALPQLRSGEKGTADLFQGEDQPFNLAGETGIDHGARQQEQERQEREAAEAREAQYRAQGDLFNARPTEEGNRSMGQVPLPKRETFAPPAPVEPLDAPAREEKPATDIADFGEKIGGARKDLARPLGPREKTETPAANAEQPAWQRKYVVTPETKRDYTTPGKAELKPTGKFLVKRADGVHVRTPTFDTAAQAEAAIPLIEAARNHAVGYTRQPDGSSDWHIFRKVGDHKRPIVKSGFASHDEATSYLATHPREMIEHKFAFPERPWLDRLERTGGNPRTGDVSPKMFQDAFGFRGGEFGNWNKGGDGQAALNHAYDALHDLSDILGVSPKALSLNGELAIAFGARGHGGADAGAAHYEPGHQVINLTKIKGAGSLAHEWFHALDHYLGRQDGKATDRTQAADARDASGRDPAYVRGEYASHGFSRQSGTREELRNAFKGVIDATAAKRSDFTVSSDKLADLHAHQADALKGTLASLRQNFTTMHEYGRTKKAATPEQLAEFDRLAGTIARGDVGEKINVPAKNGGRMSFGRMSYSPIEELNTLYKNVLGRSFATNDEGSQGKKLYWQIGSMLDAQRRVDNAGEAGKETMSRPVATDFLKEARKIDGQRASDYWSTPHEMGARSFESYVADKLENSDRKNDYLANGVDNRLYAMFGLKPYPEGEERATLNRAWQHVFDTIQEKPTARGNALHAAEPEPVGAPTGPEPRETRVPVSDAVFNQMGVAKANVFADYGALAKKHPEYFSNGHEAKAYVEHVMEKPTEILPGAEPDHRLIVRSNGGHKSVALEVELRGGKYRVRSAHTLSDQQMVAKRIAAGLGATPGVPRVNPEASQETPSGSLGTSRGVPHGGNEEATTSAADQQPSRRGSTQLTLSPEDARPVQNYARSIPESAVYSEKDAAGKEKYGRELEPHVTSLYGLTGEGDTPDAVRGAVAGHGPVSAKLGKLSLFSNPDAPYDVLKADVDSPGLHALNGKLRNLPHQNDYPDYQPHMTLAYLKKGEGDRYVGKNPFQGKELSFSDLTHSSADRVKTQIPLDAPAPGSSDSTRLAAAEPESFMDDTETPEGAASAGKPGVVSRIKDATAGVVNKLIGTPEHRALVDRIAAGKNAVDTMAGRSGIQAGHAVELSIPDKMDRQAAGVAVEAGYNPRVLAEDLVKVQASPDKKLAAKYAPILQHAIDNLPRLRDAAEKFRGMDAREDAAAEAAGLSPRWQNRVKHIFNDPTSPESTLPIDHGFGATKGFKKSADAIAAGVDPHSTDLADLAAHMVTTNRRAINGHAFENGLANLRAEDGKPILGGVVETSTKLNDDGTVTSNQKLPKGYDAVQAGPNVLTIHKQFAPLVKSLYGESAFDTNNVLSGIKSLAAAAKHGTAMLDFYHASRILTKAGLGFQTTGWDKGLAALDYAPEDRADAVKAGKFSQADADWADKHDAVIDRGLKAGLNVGAVSDNLLSSAKQHGLFERLPVVGKALTATNDLIFKRITRGAMTQAFTVAAERNAKRFPELSEAEVDRRSAKEVNEFFGNLGSQGLFKNKTMQDAARVIGFSPQWTESQIRSEARGYGQAAKSVADAIQGKGFRPGVVAQAMGGTLLAGIVASQALNLFTRGKTTWQNEEDGHQWDAWIPGGANGRGFWFSPLSVAAEYAHEMRKYTENGNNALDAVAHIASNKLSGPARGAKDLLTGEDYAGRPFGSTGERMKAAATDTLPSPMPLSGVLQKDPKAMLGYGLNHQPGSLEKQGLGMLGLKVDAAPSARAQMYRTAEPFRASGGGGAHAPSAYGDLRRMLDANDLKGAGDEVRRLTTQGGKSLKDINHAMGIRDADGSVRPELFTGNGKSEHMMYEKLTVPQRRVYQQAQREHTQIAERFKAVRARGGLPAPVGS